jgi:hypothetical protein
MTCVRVPFVHETFVLAKFAHTTGVLLAIIQTTFLATGIAMTLLIKQYLAKRCWSFQSFLQYTFFLFYQHFYNKYLFNSICPEQLLAYWCLSEQFCSATFYEMTCVREPFVREIFVLAKFAHTTGVLLAIIQTTFLAT